jgi:hypothetical protein
MFENWQPQCPICIKRSELRTSSEPITWSKSFSTDEYVHHFDASVEFWSLPKSKCRIRGECSSDRKREFSSIAYGNQLQSIIRIDYGAKHSNSYSGALTIHMDYVNVGHAFWHGNNPNCYEGGYSELGFAKFSNWYIMLAGLYMISQVPAISALQKRFDDPYKPSEFIAYFLKYIHQRLYNKMLEKSIASCSLNEHRLHSHIYEEEFRRITANSLQFIDMIANDDNPYKVAKFAMENTKNYLYQYKYHFFEWNEKAKFRYYYSEVFENKIYGPKIRLPEYSELADLE